MAYYVLKNRVSEARKNKNLTQSELADKAGVNEKTIRRIERDDTYELKASTEHLIAKVLDEAVEDLFWLEEREGA